jgi:hypothetical protein
VTAIRKGGHMNFDFIIDMGFLFVVGVIIFGTYFVGSDGAASLARRVVSSAPGPCIVLFFMIVRCLALGRALQFEKYTDLFLWSQILPGVLILYSLVFYPGPKKIHLWLLVIIPFWFLLVVFGFLIIHGE